MSTAPLNRRGFLGRTALTGLGVALAGSVEALVRPAFASAAPGQAIGYGPLVPDPNRILSLPVGFSYTVVARSGETQLDGGVPVPSDPDAIGVFARPGGSTLVTNHEIGSDEPFGVPALDGLTYDTGARGGTTTTAVGADGARQGQYVSVAGTVNNCAGGITPWGTWLTCEETEARAGEDGFLLDHGYVFEVDPASQDANRGKSPVPLKFLGRYAHEAVAVDPASSTIYLTEDASGPNGLYYRWTPPQGFRGGPNALRELAQSPGGDTAGALQAMACFQGGTHVPDLSQATEPGTVYTVQWVGVPDRDATSTSVREQFGNDVVTRSRKLEGQWWGDGGAYFVASYARTSDGSVAEHDGQVWFYDPAKQTVTLKILFGVNPDPAVDTGNYDTSEREFHTVTGSLRTQGVSAVHDLGHRLRAAYLAPLRATPSPIVLVVPCRADAFNRLRSALQSIGDTLGAPGLARTVVTVSNQDATGWQVDVDLLREYLGGQVWGIETIPYDEHLGMGIVIDHSRLAPDTRAAYERVSAAASAVAEGRPERV